jgi:DNA-binding transcriptional ArsR family regulator
MRNMGYNGNMKHDQALPKVRSVLEDVLRTPVEQVPPAPIDGYEPDAEFRASSRGFVVEYKAAASADVIGGAITSLQRVRHAQPDAIPLIVVPFMGDVGKRLCEEAGVSWLDLSGNASIHAPGLEVRIEGLPNAHARPGRPKSLFSPTYSRLAHALLLHPEQQFTAAALADLTGMHRGTLSKLLRRYADAGFLEVRGEGKGARWRAVNPPLLLDAWREAYDFSAHVVKRGNVPALAGESLLKTMADLLSEAGLEYAATGLAAAWLIEPFATYRLVTLYTPVWPTEGLMKSLGFLDEPRGANLWLVQPDDDGVLMGSCETGGVRHVGAVQTYLDLKAQPERSRDAAGALRERLRSEWGNVSAQTEVV